MAKKFQVYTFIILYVGLAVFISLLIYNVNHMLAIPAILVLAGFRVAAIPMFIHFCCTETISILTHGAMITNTMGKAKNIKSRVAILCDLKYNGFFKNNEALFYDYLALLYNDVKDYQKALKYSKKANITELIEKGCNMKLEYYRLINQSRYMIELNEYDTAEEILDHVYLYSKRDAAINASINISYARLYVEKEQPETARVYIFKARQFGPKDPMYRDFLTFLEASCDVLEGDLDSGVKELKEIIKSSRYSYVVDRAKEMCENLNVECK